jgi:hypothetical protein
MSVLNWPAWLALSSVSALLLACGSEEGPREPLPEPYLGLTTPTSGFQLRSIGADLAPGEEREYCEVARMPGTPADDYYVSRVELGNAVGSHHLVMYVAIPGSGAEALVEAVGVGNHTECPGAAIEFGEGLELITTIQVPYGDVQLPPGVAWKYHGAQYVIFDYHYANASAQTVQARSAINFHVVDAAAVESVAQGFGLNNVTIDIGPQQTASVTGECHFDADMLLGGMTRHTHHRSTDFTVWYSGGPRDSEEIWTSHDWLHETEYRFTEPALLRAGEGLRFRCTYANDTTRRLRFGTTVEDEMCMLYGYAWAAQPGEGVGHPYCNISWVDSEGVGHPADEAGGFPKPSAVDLQLCRAGYADSTTECSNCVCNNCATAGVKCALDDDCGPMLTCFSSCDDVACVQEKCQPLIQQHSAGGGLFVAATECVKASCPNCLL